MRCVLNLTLMALLLLGCSRPLSTTLEPFTFRIAGSTSMIPVIEDLVRTYQASHSNVLIEQRAGGSSVGLSALKAGEADIAVISWKPEAEKIPDGIQATPFARDGLAIIIHPTNPISKLTILQLREIYRGEVLNWNGLGGLSEEPAVISREGGSGDRAAFETLVMGGERVTLNALVMPTAEAVVDYVARHPAAVGYVSITNVTDRVRAIAIEGVSPNRDSVQAGTYHLSRLVYLYSHTPAGREVQEFLDFVVSPAGQAIVARHLAPVR